MVRTQIQLTEKQMASVRRAAAERGVSIAAVIRELVDQGLRTDEDGRRARALSVAGRFQSGTSTTSVEHDVVLDGVYGE